MKLTNPEIMELGIRVQELRESLGYNFTVKWVLSRVRTINEFCTLDDVLNELNIMEQDMKDYPDYFETKLEKC